MDEDLVKGNKDIGRKCMALIKRKMNKEMSPDEYYLSLLDLQKQYPREGHYPPLSMQVYENYKQKGIIPFSFKEAAEMYASNRARIERDCQPMSNYKMERMVYFNDRRKSLPGKERGAGGDLGE